ncbi:phosphatase PAP2 family protein [Acidisoma sp. 7E03]
MIRAPVPGWTPRILAWAALSCGGLLLVSVLFLDRPIAFAMHRAFHHSSWFLGLAAIGQVPLSGALPALVAACVAGSFGWRPRRRGWTAIMAAVATVLTIGIKSELKEIFGRTWPETWSHGNPSLIRDGVFGFFPFHGGEGWSSFPSGHTAAIAAVAGVLWWRESGLRPLWAGLVLLTAAGLLCGNIHFLADIIAGAYLGFAIGTATLVLPFPTKDRPA